MELGKAGKLLKNPMVLAVGVALGVVLLIAVSRNKSAGGSSNADFTLASQQIGSATNVALGAQATDYNKAALGYQLGLAQLAADTHAADLSASTSVTLQSLATVNNLLMAGQQVQLVKEQNAGAIAINAQNTGAYIEAQNINSRTAIELAPHAEALAQINADAILNQARTQANAATTIEQMRQATNSKALNVQSEKNWLDFTGSAINSGAALFAAL